MAANDTAALVVALSAQVSKFQKDMDQANGIADKAVKKIEDRFASLNPALSKVGGALSGIGTSFLSAAGIVGLGFSGLLATAVALNAELAKIPGLARLAGVSTDRLQEIKFAGAVKGVGDEAFTTSLDASVRLLDEAQRQVNTLSRLFAANGVSIHDQNGQLIKFDDLLVIAARLMANTRTEQEKIKVAEMLGLSREWVAALRDGPEAFRASAAGARDAGAVIDKEVLDKAKEFDKAWHEAVVRFKAGFTDALVDLSRAFSEFFSNVVDSLPGSSLISKFLDVLGSGLDRFSLPELKDLMRRSIEEGAGEIEVARIQAAIDRKLGKEPLKITVQPEIGGEAGDTSGSTVIPKDKQKNAFDSAVFEINKRIAATDAETRSVGLNTDARERAKVAAELEEAAKKANTDAGYQNATVTDLQRQKIEQLADAMQAAAKRQHDSHAELLKFAVDSGDFVKQFDQTAISSLGNLGSALVDVATGATSAKDGFKNFGLQVVRSLTEMIVKMTILAPLARSLQGLLGGGVGGGGFFGGSPETNPALVPIGSNASGTSNWRGGLSWVGERGPELLNLPGGSQIIPNNAISRTAAGGSVVNVYPVPGTTFDQRQNSDGTIDLVGRMIKDEITRFDRKLPDRVAAINADPRRR